MFRVIPYEATSWPEIWKILQPVFAAGETYAFPRDITEAQSHKVWIEDPLATYTVLGTDNAVAGTFYIKENPPQEGKRICNAGYVVSDAFSGQGIASMMCAFSQNEAAARGFYGMQFNNVASTNTRAVKLWQKLGFVITNTRPNAFEHVEFGKVDAHVMFKILDIE